jgi:cellulose synthase/poly-beta-1,6-N-acetylglucosamine synthase-like glycosyltransferase
MKETIQIKRKKGFKHQKFEKKRSKLLPFYPDDPILNIWNIILFTAMILYYIIIPYRVSFIIEYKVEWMIIDILFDIFFTFDIFMNFFTAYHDNYGKLVKNKHKIAKVYSHTYLIVDVLSIFPLFHLYDRIE